MTREAGVRLRTLLGDRAVAGVAVLTVLAAVLRFYGVGHQGFWFDEGNTALEARFSFGQMLTLIKHYESTPPLYYSLAWVWARVFGTHEAALRSLSAVFGVLTVPVAYGAAAKLISRRAGVIAAALVAFNPYLIWYSQEARAYELVVALTAASLLAFAYARGNPSRWVIAAWVLACGLALSTEYYSLLVIGPEALWLVYRHPRRRSVQAAVAALVLWGAPLLWFAISQNATGHANWIAKIPLGPRLGQIVPQFLIGYGSPAQVVLTRVAEAAALIAFVLLALRSDRAERSGAVLAGGIALAGFVLVMLLVAGGVDDLITRNVISLWVPAAIALAGGLAARRAGVAGLAATAVLCAIGLTAAVGVARDRNLQRPDWRALARVLGTRPAAGPGRAILVQHYRDLLPLSLYVPGLKFILGRHTARVSELDVVAISAPRVALCWWGAACNLTPSKLQAGYPVPGFRVVWRRRAYQFTVLHMVATQGPVRITRPEVSAVLHTTTLRRDELLLQR
jgi:hypothetical protein